MCEPPHKESNEDLETLLEKIKLIKAVETVEGVFSQTAPTNRENRSGEQIKGDISSDIGGVALETRGRPTTPKYGPGINSTTTWQSTSPIILTALNLPIIGAVYEGIYLERGFYRVAFTLVNVHSGQALGVFDAKTKKLKQILTYQTYSGGVSQPGSSYYKHVVRYTETSYVQVDEPAIIALTNNKAEFRPGNFEGAIVITVYRYKSTPN